MWTRRFMKRHLGAEMRCAVKPKLTLEFTVVSAGGTE